jgi:hypothetical protein
VNDLLLVDRSTEQWEAVKDARDAASEAVSDMLIEKIAPFPANFPYAREMILRIQHDDFNSVSVFDDVNAIERDDAE